MSRPPPDFGKIPRLINCINQRLKDTQEMVQKNLLKIGTELSAVKVEIHELRRSIEDYGWRNFQLSEQNDQYRQEATEFLR